MFLFKDKFFNKLIYRGRRDRMVVGSMVPEQSVSITTKGMSPNPLMVRCIRYNIM